MKKTKFSEEQIAFALKQAETGTAVKDVLRQMGITEQTFYRWKRKYECLWINVNQGLRGHDVVEVLDLLKAMRGVPKTICVDNGSEFISKVMDKWAYENKVTLSFSRPGKPTDNALVESFNGSFRDECLNVNWFSSLEDAKMKVEAWRKDYNDFRPHSSLGNMTPSAFAKSEVGQAA